MLMLLALSMAAAPAASSPIERGDPATSMQFTATATIRRGAGVGPKLAAPALAQAARRTTVTDAAGQPHLAVIYDFE
jgi:hypothetical protein